MFERTSPVCSGHERGTDKSTVLNRVPSYRDRRNETACAPPVLRFDEVLADRKANEFAEAFEIHLVHDVIAMTFHRARGDSECCGRFLVAFALCEELHDFHFAGS